MEDDLNIDDIRAAHPFWVLLQQQKREVRELLASKLNESLKADKPSKVAEPPNADESSKKEDRPKKPLLPSKEAMEFVSSLSVKGERRYRQTRKVSLPFGQKTLSREDLC